MKNECGQIVHRRPFAKVYVVLVLLAAYMFSSTATAQSVTVQFLNGKSGKPIAKGSRIWVYFNDKTGRQIVDLRTDRQGAVQFETNDAKTFQVSAVGYVGCGEQPIGSSPRDYPIDEVLKTGLLTWNDCGRLNAEPLQGR